MSAAINEAVGSEAVGTRAQGNQTAGALNGLPGPGAVALGVQEEPRLPFPPTVLGIAGCSGSGKTTLANELARTLR